MARWFSWGRGTLTKIALVGLAVALTSGAAVASSGGSKSASVSPVLEKGIALAASAGDQAQAGSGSGNTVTVGHSVKNDTSPTLRNITPKPVTPLPVQQALATPPIVHQHTNRKDTAVQSKLAAPKMPAPGLNFDGISFPGVSCFCAPPDTNGEVGSTQYVQIVNEGLQVFDKTTGNSLFGPVAINSLWSGFGGPCETDGLGDPIVLYDQLANRWLVSQLALFPPTHECVAVSTSDDATGAYNRYDFDLGSQFGVNFYDYPKLSVWPDAYYMSFNMFNSSGSQFLGPQPFALDRSAMLAGNPATVVSTGMLGPTDDQLMPGDLDGSIQPDAGAPNPFTEVGTNSTWKLWRFHVDFGTPGNSTFTLGGNLAPDPFSVICGGGACVPQAGTGDVLDTLGDRSMFRNAYRRFADGHEALVGNMTVESNGVAGIRWYEIDNATSGTPSFVQQSTYQPDNTWRWMGSAAMDHFGDIAVGFSASSSAINPQIRYAGRLRGDPPNALGQGEAHLFDGTGSQIDTFSRWGDYSDLTVDPNDDCTFWYTTEYYQVTSSFNWRTRIGNFKFPNCTTGPSGILAGTVTDASNNNPIAGAKVDTPLGSTTTDGSGHYSINLPVGTYDVTYSRFGYATHTEPGVQITDGNTTTKDVALQPSPSVTVSGNITDGSGHGWPLYSRIDVAGDPDSPFFTDPITGHYSIPLPANASYDVTFSSQLTGYQLVQQTVDVGGTDMTHDVQIPVTPDCTAPGYSQGSPCVVIPGGLVEGNVFDLATGDPINGATVQSDDAPTEKTKTFATPDDPNNPDGFYWLFSSLTGPHPFTASAPKHAVDTETVNVAGDGTVRQDFHLGAGHLTISPTSISTTQVLGTTTTRTLSFHNDGTGPAHVKLSERGGSFQILGATGLPELAPPDAVSFSKRVDSGPASVLNGRTGEASAPAPASPDWASGAPVPAGIVRYAYAQCADDPNVFYVISGVSNGFIVNTNYRYDASTNTWTTLAPIPTGQESPSAACLDGRIYVMGGGGTNQMFIYDIASNSWGSGAAVPEGTEGAVAGALDGKVYLIGGDNDFFPADGVYDHVRIYDVGANSWSSGTPMPVGSSNPGGVQAGEFVYVVGGWGPAAPGSNLNVTERYDMSSNTWETGPQFTPAKADFALAASGAALYAIAGDANGGFFFDASTSVHRLDLGSWPGGTWDDLADPLPGPRTANQAGFCTSAITGGETWSVGGIDSFFVWHNDAFYRASGEGCAGVNVPWLDESPAEFDVPVGATVNVTVTLKATSDVGIIQPGTGSAQIAVNANTPQTINPIGVTMNVTPPTGWGKIAGTVTGTDCSGKTNPLKAVVFATGKNFSFTARTDTKGKYGFWGPSASNPYTLIASASGWIPQTKTASIRPGRTIRVDFNLRPTSC
jgi:Carboxypeptidase regulatory-like domain/Kelch motif/Galactose oxidase, central domain